MLNQRRDTIAQQWAVVITPYTDFDPVSVQVHFGDLAEQLEALLFSESFEYEQAQAIGEDLAELASYRPEALGKTQEVLWQYFTAKYEFM